MTNQNRTQKHDNNNANEASSLLLTVAGGGGGVAATQKKHGVSRRAMIATMCFLLGTLAVIYVGRGSSSSNNSNSRGMLVDVFGGKPCCPKNTDGCTAFNNKGQAPMGWGDKNCNFEGFVGRGNKNWKDLGNGIICKPRVGGFCCDDSTSKHYTWWSINFGGMVGCVQESYFRCLDGSNCCFEGTGVRDSSCPGCDGSCFKCVGGEKCCSTFQGLWDFKCPGCGGSF